MDQGRQARSEDDALVLPPIPLQQGAAVASVMAYNLGNLWRRLVVGEMFVEWFLDSPAERQLRLVGAKTTREERMQVVGSKDGGWVYTAHDSGVQNGNSV